jgi:hypothetical protein
MQQSRDGESRTNSGSDSGIKNGDENEFSKTEPVGEPYEVPVGSQGSSVNTAALGSAGKRPNTGKELIPCHDGKVSMREYERRVRLFQSFTSIDLEYQAGKLIEKLSDEAWAATESLDVQSLKCKQGVDMLLKHLWNELEPLAYLRTFNTLSFFFKHFKRQRGQEMVSFDSEFRNQCKRLDEIGSPLAGTAKAYWYLEKASISEELKRQVVSSANGEYQYEKLRNALVAIVPQVRKNDEDAAAAGGSSSHGRWGSNNGRQNRNSYRVHAVEQEDETEEPDPNEPSENCDTEPHDEADELEKEAAILMTHAAKKRSEAMRNRGYARPESGEDREKRVKDMKARMPCCAACKSHGHTRYGHWHGDVECPYHKDHQKPAGSTFVVTQDPMDESDSDDAYFVGVVQGEFGSHFGISQSALVLATSSQMREQAQQMALADTCCARTVCGLPWFEKHLEVLESLNVPCIVVEDRQPFRFGAGPRVESSFAAIFPLFVGQNKNAVLLRTSVVMEDVPLLISSKALRMLGTLVNLDEQCYEFRRIKTRAELINTPTGHIGFNILKFENELIKDAFEMDWKAFAESEEELAFSQRRKDRRVTCIPSVHRGSIKTSDTKGDAVYVTSEQHGDDSSLSLKCPSDIQIPSIRDGSPSSKEQVHEEGGLCDGVAGHDVPDSRCTAFRLSRTTEGDLWSHEAGPEEDHASQLETVQQGRADSALCGTPESSGSQLSAEEQGRADHGVGDLPRSRRRGRIHPSRVSRGQNATVSLVPSSDGRTEESDDGRSIPRMQHVSPVQDHHADGFHEPAGQRQPWGGIREHIKGLQEYLRGWGGGHGRERSCSSSSQGGEVDMREALTEDEVRKRINAGNVRRREAKKGTVKRWLGNCSSMLAAACFLTASVASNVCTAGASLAHSRFGDVRPDLIEIFSGNSTVSLQFAKRGWNVCEPVDIVFGSDLKDEETRESVKDTLRNLKPRLAIVSYPCPLWGTMTNVNYRTKQAKRKLARLQKQDEPFLKFVEDIFTIQTENGCDALAENPLPSLSFQRPPIQRVLCRPGIFTGVSHGCRFGLRNCQNNLLLKKPTLWISTSWEICDSLSKRCTNTKTHINHQHGQCLGSNVSKEAAKYTKEMAKAIHQGFVKLVRRKEPNRLKRMLLSVKKRLGTEDHKDLKWNHDSIQKILRQTNSVYVGEQDVPMGGDLAEGNRPVAIDPAGVSFEIPNGRKLDSVLRSALTKVHANLGHPSVEDTQRFLRGAGAPQELVEAAGWLKCSVCAKSSKPRIHRSVRMPPHDLQFNDQIMIDCFHVKDMSNKGHWFMSLLDRATMYHLVTRIDDHSPATFTRVFFHDWCKWAGFPLEVSIDMERGFGSQEFVEALGKSGVHVVPIASQAHWQHGKVERHGSVVKDMIMRVFQEVDPKTPEHVQWVADEVTGAKNMLVREHGFSPGQLLFGKEPRCFGEIEANGEPISFHFSVGDRNSKVAMRMKMRHEARMAYVKSQAQNMLQRTARNRTRQWKNPQVGDKCFFYHEFRKKGVSGKVKGWCGPALVVGLQGMSNIWIVFGGKCFLVAQEHCREAIGEEHLYGRPEVQEALTLFKQGGSGKHTYLDLTDEATRKVVDIDDPVYDEYLESDEEMIPDEQYRANPSRVQNIPDELISLCREPGWKKDGLGNPVHVGYKVYAFKIPIDGGDLNKLIYRTTWVLGVGKWRLLEDEVRWDKLDEPQDVFPGGPYDIAVTIFKTRSRRQACLDDVPVAMKRQKIGVFMTSSKRKAQRALDKEVPYSQIPEKHRELYHQAERKEWDSWLQYDAVQALSLEQSKRVLTSKPERVLKSRFVYRDKNAGLVGEDMKPVEVRAKARLCVQGQHDPDCQSGEVKVDAPTIQHGSLMTFLHCVISFGWERQWRNGDISSAFLQGEPSKGEPLYMFPPERGLPGIHKDQILLLKRPVYGRPDAPRAWYEAISQFIMEDMGFERSILDPAMFIHRNEEQNPDGILVLHVDDLMVATDGNPEVEECVGKLVDRFPFGEWGKVAESTKGITYCGKEIKLELVNGEHVIRLKQKGFADGRLEPIPIDKNRRLTPEALVTETERSDFRSVLGSLQWLSTQSRPDISFTVNQLQKRVNKLNINDLEVANKVVKIVKSCDLSLCFRNLGKDVAIVSWHDAGLYNSVGKELEDDDGDHIQSLADKRLLYSQKGCMVGICRREDVDRTTEVSANFVAWKSKTDKRILESSFGAETHAALLGHSSGHYQRTLLMEIYYGSWVVKDADAVSWEKLMPLRMITDCKSVYDTIKRDGQSVGDRSNAINVAILRQLCVADSNPPGQKAKLLWVPTRHQVADPLTKGGRHKLLQSILETGGVTFHGISAKQHLKSRRDLDQCESDCSKPG